MRNTRLELANGKSLEIFYDGNTDSKKAIVFSHGIGTRWDDRGLLTDIGDFLQKDYSLYYFDYNKIDLTNTVTVPSISEQTAKLEAVLTYANQMHESVSVITHSFGSLVQALASTQNTNIDKIIMLTPPPNGLYRGLLDHFGSRPGAIIDFHGISKLPRANGSFTYIEKDFWKELKSIEPEAAYSMLSKNNNVYSIIANQDDVITDSYDSFERIHTIKHSRLDGDHAFTQTRTYLKNLITGILNSKKLNQDELLDLVNEEDSVIGKVWKSVAHANEDLIHREVAVLIFNIKGQTLIQKRSLKKLVDPGAWRIVAGHVAADEDINTAMQREIKEEIGINVDLQFYQKSFYKDQTNSESKFYWIYYAIYDGDNFELDEEEVSEVKWVNLKELSEKNETEKYDVGSIVKEYTERIHSLIFKNND